jgi:predicted enzyme related to lactoylglutathione lyase
METTLTSTANAVTGIGFVTAFVEDFDQALRFYTEVLGMSEPMPMGSTACYFIFPNDTGMYLIGGNTQRSLEPKSARMTFALEVPSAGELFAKAKELGITPLQDEPMQMNDEVVWFQIHDPAGNLIEIVGGK